MIDEEDSRAPALAPVGAWIVTVASLFGLLGGMVTNLPATTIGWACAFAIIVGSLLL